eukprot:675879-Rhodomonas_salina.1
MEVVAEMDGFDPELFTPMHVELNNFSSVHEFVDNLHEFKASKPVDRLICNAGVSCTPPPSKPIRPKLSYPCRLRFLFFQASICIAHHPLPVVEHHTCPAVCLVES